MSGGVMHGGMAAGPQQQMWNDHQGYGSAPVGLAAWVDAHAYPVPPPPPENEGQEEGGHMTVRKVAALEVENCEMAGKMAGMEALLREREMEASEMKQQLLAYEHVLEGERRGEPLSKAELLKQVIALSAQLQELSKAKTNPPPVVGAEEGTSALPPPPGAAPSPSAPAPQKAASPPKAAESQQQSQGFDDQPSEAPKQQSAAQAISAGGGFVAPPPVRIGKNTEAQVPYQSSLPPVQLQQAPPMGHMQQYQQQGNQWGQEAYQTQQQLARPPSRGDLRIPASPRAGMGGMIPASPRVGGMVPASPRVGGMPMGYAAPRVAAVPASPRIAYNRVPQSPRMGGGMVPQSPRVAAGPFAQVPYYNDRPMTSPGPLMHRSPSVGAPSSQYAQTAPLGHSASFGGAPMTPSGSFRGASEMMHSASFGGSTGLNPMTPSAQSVAPSAFGGHNVQNMNQAEMYGGDITASGLSAVRGSLLTFSRAKNLQAKESVLRHLDSMVEHGRVSPDEVVAGVMEKCAERMRMVPPPPRQSGGILSNLAGKAKLKAQEDEFLKNANVAEVGMLASTIVAFEWAPSSSYIELLETVPDLVTRRLLTLEFLNGIFGRCGKLAVAKVINELACLDSLVGDGLLPSVRELSNCMVLVMVNTKRSVEWRRKWILGKA